MLKVVQWATGPVGRHTAGGRGRPPRPRGRRVSSCTATTRWAATRASSAASAPIGVVATSDRDEILALDADCVLYMPQGETNPMARARRHLRAARLGEERRLDGGHGADLPGQHGPGRWSTGWRRRAPRVVPSFHATGIEPGWASEVLPLTMSGTVPLASTRWSSRSCSTTRPTPARSCSSTSWASAGRRMRRTCSAPTRQLLGGAFRAPLMLVADGLGATIDDFVYDRQVWLAEEPFDVSAGRIEAGTVAAHALLRHAPSSTAAGRSPWSTSPASADDAAPDWPGGRGWKVTVEGAAVDGARSRRSPCTARTRTTRAASARPCTPSTRSRRCARRRPGSDTFLDLPTIVGRHVLGCDGGRMTRDVRSARRPTGTPASRSTTGRGCGSTRPRTGTRRTRSGRSPATTTCSRSRRTAATFSSHRAPRPHGDHLPMMISMDDPEHSPAPQAREPRVHAAARAATTSRRSAGICTEIIDRVAPKGECDFVWDIAAPLPLLAHRRHARLPARVLRRPAAVVRRPDPRPRPPTRRPRSRRPGMEAMLAFREFQLGVIADRRSKPPQDDLVSILCYSEIDGERLDDESIIQESLLILIGGDETSRHVMTDGMLALLEHPDQLAILRDDPATIEVGRRGAAALGVADQEHGPHGHARRSSCTARRCARATRSSSCTRRPTATRRCSTIPTASTCGATRTRTSRSGSVPHFCLGALARPARAAR